MIPKIIHYCWVGGKPKPDSVLRCIESWKRYCPSYKIIEWNESNLNFENAPLFVKQAYEAGAWGFVPDYYRLWIVYNYGGIYLDTDVQLLKPLDPLLINQAYAGFEGDYHVAFGLGFGAEPYNEMIFEHLMLYSNMAFLNKDGTQNRLPSPAVTTEWLCKKGLQLGQNSIQIVGSFHIYPKEYFCPKEFDTGITRVTKNTYSIHHYDASWFTDAEQKALLKARKKYRLDRIRYAPNRLIKTLLGEKRYGQLKNIFANKKM